MLLVHKKKVFRDTIASVFMETQCSTGFTDVDHLAESECYYIDHICSDAVKVVHGFNADSCPESELVILMKGQEL